MPSRTLQQLLSNKGKPLYQLRLTQEEFELIKEELEDIFQRSLESLARRSDHAAIFVLYAAEWWKRFYDGGHWTWAPIIESLGRAPSDWSVNERSRCVEIGLEYWQLPPNERGLRYLGAIAVQGGLPMRLLAEHQHSIGHMLKRLIDLAEGSNASEQNIIRWAENLRHQLPQSYRQEMIFALLAQIVRICLSLKEEANLQGSGDPIAKLDNEVTDWRDRFPIVLSDAATNRLIEGLITEAAAHRPRQVAAIFKVVRLLTKQENRWSIQSYVEYGDTVDEQLLKDFFNLANDDHLSRCLEVRFVIGGMVESIAMRRLAGHAKYRFKRKPLISAEGQQACGEHAVVMRDSALGHEWRATARYGHELSPDMPWIFAEYGNEWRFIREGGGRIAHTKAIVAIPNKWHATSNKAGILDDCGRRMFYVDGEAYFEDPSGQKFRIRTHQDATEGEYQWVGRRVWEAEQVVFKGHPELKLIREDGRALPIHNVEWRRAGTDTWSRHEKPIGPVEFRYATNGEVLLRGKMIILPLDASIQCAPGPDPDHASIRFVNWNASHAQLLTEGVLAQCQPDGSSLDLSLSSTAAHPPESIEIALFWPHAPTQTKVRLPFPAKGGRFFDAEGNVIPSGSKRSIPDIYGIRAWVFGDFEPLLVFDSQKGLIHRKVPTRENRAEIRLVDYEADIHRLLSSCDELDACVKVELDVRGVSRPCSIEIQRYVGVLAEDESCVRLDNATYRRLSVEELNALPIYALRLDRPGEEPERLETVYSEGVPVGWRFDPEEHTPAPWLIYPGKEAGINLRPYLWPYEYDEGTDGDLSKAMRVQDRTAREQRLDRVIECLAGKFLHPEWGKVEQLANELGHLPLVTLDLWRRFANSPTGMAALAFRMSRFQDGFVERFAEELPFIWEMVSAIDWWLAMEATKQQCQQWYGESLSESLFDSHMNQCIKWMSATYPSLDHLLGAVKNHVRGCPPEENRALDEYFRNALFHAHDSPFQRLLQAHAEDDQWPEYFRERVSAIRGEYPDLLHEFRDYRESVINLPVMLAIQAVTGREMLPRDKDSIHAMRDHRAFDPDWFDTAFDYTVVRCLSRGMWRF